MAKRKGLNRKLNYGYIFIGLLFLALIFNLIYMFYLGLSIIEYNGSKDEVENKSLVELQQINDYQYVYILKAMIELEDAYLEKINHIYFSGNQSWVADKCNSIYIRNYSKGWVGQYTSGCHFSHSNNIYVFVEDNESIFRDTLCHEILHEAFVMNDLTEEEEVVDGLSYKEICYKKINNGFDIYINNSKLNKGGPLTIKKNDGFFLRYMTNPQDFYGKENKR